MTDTKNIVKEINLYDNEYIRYSNEDQERVVGIHHDAFVDAEDNPRGTDYVNIAHLYCWHRRYSLGDKHHYDSSEEFLYDLAEQYISMDRIREIVESGETNIETAHTDDMFLLIEHDLPGKQYVIAEEKTEPELFSEENKRDILEAFDFGPISLLQTSDDIVILPLYLMDHSGLSISVSDFADRWDSGQVGWAYILKEDFLRKTGYSETDWMKPALETIKAEVRRYDQFLSGDIYWAEIFERDEDGNWESVDSCSGFYGSDILENDVAEFADGLYDAIQSGEYTTGTATEKRIVTTIWEFD